MDETSLERSGHTWSYTLHLPHTEGVFGVTFNDITKDDAFYNTYFTFCGLDWCFLPGTSGLVIAQG